MPLSWVRGWREKADNFDLITADSGWVVRIGRRKRRVLIEQILKEVPRIQWKYSATRGRSRRGAGWLLGSRPANGWLSGIPSEAKSAVATLVFSNAGFDIGSASDKRIRRCFDVVFLESKHEAELLLNMWTWPEIIQSKLDCRHRLSDPEEGALWVATLLNIYQDTLPRADCWLNLTNKSGINQATPLQ